jgi:TetR/AcrR family tetracycline transcriptional repressor
VSLKTGPATEQQPRLSRERIVLTALRLVDEHGLEALSMHKLGAELGVKAMSLYNHVTNKDDLLDGVVETLWSEVEVAAPAEADWCRGVRAFAHALRDVVRRHPNASPLIIGHQIIAESALRIIRAHVGAARDGGWSERDAYALLRTLTSYALGSALAEVCWGMGGTACAPSVDDLLRPGVPEELAQVAHVFCGEADLDAQFELGLDLMLGGSAVTPPDHV